MDDIDMRWQKPAHGADEADRSVPGAPCADGSIGNEQVGLTREKPKDACAAANATAESAIIETGELKRMKR